MSSTGSGSPNTSDEKTDCASDSTRDGNRGEYAGVPVYRSRDLFREGKRVHIEHDAGTYTLQITRQGKLILTK